MSNVYPGKSSMRKKLCKNYAKTMQKLCKNERVVKLVLDSFCTFYFLD